MADVQIISAKREGDAIVVTGTGFTKTTTTVEVDGEPREFTWESDTVIRIQGSGSSISIVKGEVTDEAEVGEGEDEPAYADSDQSTGAGEEPYKTATPDTTPGDLTKDDEQTTSNVSEEDLATAANAGAENKQMRDNEPDRTPLEPGQHLPGADFRSRVENTAAGDLNWDPREPYPVGNPPDPREEFHRIHGYYKDDEAAEETP